MNQELPVSFQCKPEGPRSKAWDPRITLPQLRRNLPISSNVRKQERRTCFAQKSGFSVFRVLPLGWLLSSDRISYSPSKTFLTLRNSSYLQNCVNFPKQKETCSFEISSEIKSLCRACRFISILTCACGILWFYRRPENSGRSWREMETGCLQPQDAEKKAMTNEEKSL